MSEKRIRTYGGWRIPKDAGLGKLSFKQSMGLLLIMVGTIITFSLGGPIKALVFTGTALFVLWLFTTTDRHGFSLADRMVIRMKFSRAQRRKTNLYRAGVATPTHGHASLPGLLAATTISEHRDAYDRPFSVIHHGDGTLAVTMSVSPSGSHLVDQEHIDQAVAYWGMWLADLTGELGITYATVTIETVPDSGARLSREVRTRMDPEAPQIARDILHDITSEYRTGAARTRAWVTLVFDPTRMSVKRRNQAQAARDIASRLPGLTQTLKATGAGAVHLLDAADMCRLVRIAYDPISEDIFEQADSQGDTVRLTWGEVGPSGANAQWDHYQHDSGISRSWIMTAPPRGIIQSGILTSILGASRDVDRKRITILYRPVDAAKAPDVVEKDLNRAAARVESAPRPTARAQAELSAAHQVAMEEAGGAGLVDFGLIITATTASDDLDDTASAVTSLASASRLLIRVAYGAQDSTFAMGLPLGFQPHHQKIG